MNFSEYTLVSFGDSFTFGQDTVPGYKHQAHGLPAIHKQWKKDCNVNSYTQVIADRMGFKDNLNFGIIGGSNERSLTLLESFLRTNPDKKVFVLFNFTSASRFLNIFKVDGKNQYDIVDLIPNVEAREWISEERYTSINEKSIIKHYTYWRNSVQDVYSHIKDRRNLYYLLSSHNTPHVTFDIINNTDALMLRDNPLEYILSNDGFGVDFMYKDDADYVLKEMDFFKSYYTEILTNTPLLCHMGIDELGGVSNLAGYLNSKAKFEYEDKNYYSTIYSGGHWNIEGHHEVGKLIEDFIKKKYKN